MSTSNYVFSGIDHVQIAAPENSEPVARHFYCTQLGMLEIQKPEILVSKGGIWLDCGSHQIHIGIQKDFHPAKKAHPAILIENIPNFRKYLEKQSIPTIEGETLNGIERFFILDPFGNRIEFMSKSTK